MQGTGVCSITGIVISSWFHSSVFLLTYKSQVTWNQGNMNGYISDVNLLLQFSVSHHVKKIYDEASYLASCLLVETSSSEDFQSISELIERITMNRQKAGEVENESRSLVKLQNILSELKLFNLKIGKYIIFDQCKLFFFIFYHFYNFMLCENKSCWITMFFVIFKAVSHNMD